VSREAGALAPFFSAIADPKGGSRDIGAMSGPARSLEPAIDPRLRSHHVNVNPTIPGPAIPTATGAVFKLAIRARALDSFRDSWFLAPSADDARVLRELGLNATEWADATATWAQPCRRLIIVVGDRPAALRAASALACTIAARSGTELGLCVLPGLGSRYSSLRHWCAAHDFLAMLARTQPWPSSTLLEGAQQDGEESSLRGLARSAIDLRQGAAAAIFEAPDPGARECPLDAARALSCLGLDPVSQAIGQECRIALERCRGDGFDLSTISSRPARSPALAASFAMIVQTVELPHRRRVGQISLHAATATVDWCRLLRPDARSGDPAPLDRQFDSLV
jgi:hypothetical protein